MRRHLTWHSLVLAVCLFSVSTRGSVIKFETKHEKIEFDLDDSVDMTIDEFDEQEESSPVSKFDNYDEDVEITNATCPWPPYPPPAQRCPDRGCDLPDCRCSGDDIPGKLPPSQTPQMIVLSFQNAVHVTNINLYLDLFEGRKNPNRCPATGTFFVSGKYSNFYDVQTLYSLGHEIGNNGAEERDLPTYWYDATVWDWCRQIRDDKNMLTNFANVRRSDINGFRTPYLYMGGNTQFQAYKNCHVKYDATRVALNYPGEPNLMWPYTYDYLSTQDCPIGHCPNASFPGIWQMPLEALPDPRGVPCADLQGCQFKDKTDVLNTLKKAFNARYYADRAPMMISIGTAFMLTDFKANGLAAFLDTLKYKKDVYLVTANQVIEWTKRPCPVGRRCPVFDCPKRPPVCAHPRTCNYDTNFKFVPRGSQGIIYVMKACISRCPACYPKLGDPFGRHC